MKVQLYAAAGTYTAKVKVNAGQTLNAACQATAEMLVGKYGQGKVFEMALKA